jgi:hypothetical protein
MGSFDTTDLVISRKFVAHGGAFLLPWGLLVAMNERLCA